MQVRARVPGRCRRTHLVVARILRSRSLRTFHGCLSADNAFRSDCLPERRRLEPPVSREFLPRENRRKYSRSFASKSAKHRPESEFAFSSVGTKSLALNSGVARNVAGSKNFRLNEL